MKWNISCHTIWQTMLLSTLQQLLEMSAFCPKTFTPPVNCIVHDALVHAVPSVQQTLLQFINAVQLRLMHSLLDVTPYLVIDRIKVGAVRRPQSWTNKSGCWLLKKSYGVACPVCRCAACLVGRTPDTSCIVHGQQLLRQEHVVAIAAVDLHPRMDKDEVLEAKPWDADEHHNISIKCWSGAQLVANLNFGFPKVA